MDYPPSIGDCLPVFGPVSSLQSCGTGLQPAEHLGEGHGLPLALSAADTSSGHGSGLFSGPSCCRRNDGVMKDLQNCSNSPGIRVIMLDKMNFILL